MAGATGPAAVITGGAGDVEDKGAGGAGSCASAGAAAVSARNSKDLAFTQALLEVRVPQSREPADRTP